MARAAHHFSSVLDTTTRAGGCAGNKRVTLLPSASHSGGRSLDAHVGKRVFVPALLKPNGNCQSPAVSLSGSHEIGHRPKGQSLDLTVRSDPELFLQAPVQPEAKILGPCREGSRAVPKYREHGRELRLR
jgi:hypothetical protein